MEEIIKEVQRIKQWIIDNKTLPDFKKNNNEYMKFAVESSNNVRYLMFVAAGMISEGKDGYNREDAVIVGLFVRLCKLYDTLCWHAAENHAEIVQIFVRLIFESSINLEYLMTNGKKSIENFIFISYKATKENYEDLIKKKEGRELTGIEKRILAKIERQLQEDEVDIEKLCTNKNWRVDGKSFKNILKELNFEGAYSYIFGNGSSYVHGDWKDLKANHLDYKQEQYYPRLEHDRVDPRYLCPASVICLDALVEFLKWNKSDADNFVISTAIGMNSLIRNFDAQHEKDLQEAWRGDDEIAQ